MDGLLDRKAQKLEAVIEIAVDDDALIGRISGRFSCANCGTGYHDVFKKPKQEGVCDNVWMQGIHASVGRSREDAVRTRLVAYHEQTAPLLPYYGSKGVLKTVDGMGEIDAVTDQIFKEIDG